MKFMNIKIENFLGKTCSVIDLNFIFIVPPTQILGAAIQILTTQLITWFQSCDINLNKIL